MKQTHVQFHDPDESGSENSQDNSTYDFGGEYTEKGNTGEE